MLFDTHPFVRPFDPKVYKGIFEVVKPYEDVRPFGEVPTFHWHNNPWAALPQCLGLCSHKV